MTEWSRNLAYLTPAGLHIPGAGSWHMRRQTKGQLGVCICKKLPYHFEGEDPGSWPWTLLGLFWKEELPLWCWGQGAWGLLIAYLGGGEGHVLEEAIGGEGGLLFLRGSRLCSTIYNSPGTGLFLYYCE